LGYERNARKETATKSTSSKDHARLDSRLGTRPARRPLTVLLVFALLAAALVLTIAACSHGNQNTTVSSAASTSFSIPTTSTTQTTLPPIDKDIGDTSVLVHNLQLLLVKDNAPVNDPRMAIVFALRARINALSGRKAIEAPDLAVADAAMKQVYAQINAAKSLAQGEIAPIVQQAYTVIENLGMPSSDPAQADKILEQFTTQLKPLIAKAQLLTSSSSG
jgi:hypothetical protein